jgi:rhodanese-related sulfurtransferase
MYRFLVSLSLFVSAILAEQNPILLQYTGVDVVHKHSNINEEILIERVQPEECLDVHITVEHIYGGDFANKEIPKNCKKTFAITIGKVTPMTIADGVKTVGEIEVLDFIKNRSEKYPEKNILIDSRRSNWYEEFTIPSAVNLPFNEIEYDEDFEEDYYKMLKLLNIKKQGDKLDFSQAKTVLLFCNGIWCGQSPYAIKHFLQIGYPAKKLLWYRGGLQSWIMLGFNTIKPK